MDAKSEDIIKYARDILSLEGNAILAVDRLIDAEFEGAVKLLTQLPESGRVVVSGMGKAGFIGMKISATLASIGVPSFFLHPAEAIHGDLGRFTKNDVVIILSNSGETPEVLSMVSSVKRMGCPIISITAIAECSLASHSDYKITIGAQPEVGPLGLAPTTSTTVMLAIGDALAMTVLNQKDFSKEDFAFYHPGGNLGRKLMTVAELMREGDHNAVANDRMTVREVVHVVTTTKGRPGAAAIVNETGSLVGVFTDGDLRRCLESEDNFLNASIKDVMGKNPKTVAPQQLIDEALHIMTEYKIDQVIVVDSENQPIGLLDIQDILRVR